ncbi:HlyC/CorC family transporter [Erysipelothrix sp. HDW6C]|uniref:hemolysin family protein n=1 Tax=Erysipelothrix sp. HDW6C TaxID=2714930 RepID=UPI00140BB9F7|nr:hemolysin family protein [Erysipelothrix sp. HDW6C]QIK70462.1 HlyC/CorC family transporter [Erysipelothrix sp. HDW6C]
MVVQIFMLLFLVLLNAFFAGSELAFVSLNNNKLKSMADEGNRKASIVLGLKENPNQFLSTIQIGVSLASIFSGAFASEAFAEVLTQWAVANFALTVVVVKPIAMLVVTLITSYLMLVFGELVPKRIAMTNSEGFAFFVAYPIWILSKITKPIVKFLSFSTNIMLRLVGIDPHKANDEVTEEEIRIMVDAGEIDISEKEMINNIFDFDNQEVGDIMTHRTDIVGINIESTFEEIMSLVDEERFTRYPVYDDSIDKIIGLIHLRDILRYIKDSNGEAFDIKQIMREPYYVPDSKRTDELFRELQNVKMHMAVVIDEYGGTAGIVTMEDLIEEIMGNIMDEYDEEEGNEIQEIGPDEYLVEGLVDLEELEDILGIGLPIDDYDTLSGFIVSELGRIPTLEDVINDESDLVFNGYRFCIVELDEKVIAKVRVTKEKQVTGDSLMED